MLKDGRECCLRNGTENDAQEVLDVFNLTHAETDYLLTYPDENSFTVEQLNYDPENIRKLINITL